MNLPAHVTETVVTVHEYRCRICRAMMRLGGRPDQPGYAEQVLDEWINRHQHDQTTRELT